MSALRAAVVGVGYLGRFHAQKFAALEGVELVGVLDADARRAAEVAGELSCPVWTELTALLEQVDMVSVVVPTRFHHQVALRCLAAGKHVLVEKPITETVAEATELIELARKQKCILQVGHLERFNPAVVAL
jgi:predicted dehydrogenase